MLLDVIDSDGLDDYDRERADDMDCRPIYNETPPDGGETSGPGTGEEEVSDEPIAA